MEQKLKPFTIIPSDLYVQRDADRQIKNIIQDMGRPGYVLVSRQMGKTNLLLNAKRTLESSEDIFIYIDLSNSFENLKSCFENIIDTALEINSEMLAHISAEIYEKREKNNSIPPHKQHTNELRLILNQIKGKLVIILDEIDALTKTDYSDLIFSQIRSIYFSRTNYPELERLTYILSGVVEPSEIIKDPKISPFNIGQKIFLNDFNQEEYENLLKNSNLNLNAGVKDRIFFWTNGNPRMTWDLCSEVEVELATKELKIHDIDQIVKNLYLTSYNKPPIDNIRELVKNDREIRNSIVEINYDKGLLISDRIKSKLYLAGIINYNENDIRIKNEIIKKSISIEWIDTLKVEEKELLKIGIDFLEKNDYKQALLYFEKYLAQNESEEEEKSFCYYYMGDSYQRIGNYEKAIEHLNLTTFSPQDDGRMYYRTLLIKGIAHYKLQQFDDSLISLREVISSGRRDEIYIRSLFNYGSICLKSDLKEKINEAKIIFERIIDGEDLDTQKLDIATLNNIKAIAHFNLGQIFKADEDFKQATACYNYILDVCEVNEKPSVLLELIHITEDIGEKISYINSLLEIIKHESFEFANQDGDKPFLFSYDLLSELCLEIIPLMNEELLVKILPYFEYLSDSKTLATQLTDVALYYINSLQNWEIGNFIYRYLYSHLNEPEYKSEPIIIYRCVQILSLNDILYDNDESEVIKKYLELFEKIDEKIVSIDFRIFSTLIFNYYNAKKYSESQKLIDLFNSKKNYFDIKAKADFLAFMNLELIFYSEIGNNNIAVFTAKKIIEYIKSNSDIRNEKNSLLGDTGFDTVQSNAEITIRKLSTNQNNLIKKANIGRNDKIKVTYLNGLTLTDVKYKKVQKDLEEGKCIIIN